MIGNYRKCRTIGSMAVRLGVSRSRIRRIIETRRIEPIGVAGRVKVFDSVAESHIRYELNCIDAKRSARREGVGNE